MPLPSAFLNSDLISSWLKAQLNRPANVSDFARSGLLGSSFAGQDCSRTVEGQRAKDLRVEGGPERLPISHEHELNSLIHCHNTFGQRRASDGLPHPSSAVSAPPAGPSTLLCSLKKKPTAEKSGWQLKVSLSTGFADARVGGCGGDGDRVRVPAAPQGLWACAQVWRCRG